MIPRHSTLEAQTLILDDPSEPPSYIVTTKPTLTTQRVYIRPSYSKSAITAMITEVFGANGPRMINIAYHESGLNQLAKNPNSSASGLFQIMSGTWRGFNCTGDIFNARDNTLCAKKILTGQGFGAWEVVSAYGI